MKKILVICFSDLSKDSRVKRQLYFLKKNKDVHITALALKPHSHFIDEFIQVSAEDSKWDKLKRVPLLFLKKFEKFYWSSKIILESIAALKGKKFDIVIANDVESYPLAIKVSNGKSFVVFDAHEYAPKEFEASLKWRILFQRYKTYLCQQYLKKADHIITVSQGIADEYQKVFDVEKPTVITNAAFYSNLNSSFVDKNSIKVIYHGIAMKGRCIEKMIELADYLDKRFSIDFFLVQDSFQYLQYLKRIAKSRKNIQLLAPLPSDKIISSTVHYDIGLYLLSPNSFNNCHSLPNKFFEYIQSRLAIAIGPSPEMKDLVNKYECGVISSDFDPKSLADKLNKLKKKDIDVMKAKSHLAAKELSAENNCKIFNSIFTDRF